MGGRDLNRSGWRRLVEFFGDGAVSAATFTPLARSPVSRPVLSRMAVTRNDRHSKDASTIEILGRVISCVFRSSFGRPCQAWPHGTNWPKGFHRYGTRLRCL